MTFETLASRILSFNEHEDVENVKCEQNTLQVINGKMTMTFINNNLFAQLNDQRFCFADIIFSIPISLPSQKTRREYKKNLQKSIKELIKENKCNLL